MTTDYALFPAADISGTLPELLLPRGFEPDSSAQIIDGTPVWFEGDGDDCDYDTLYVHTHDERRALEIAARIAEECDAVYVDMEIAQSGWCVLVTVCGCTPEQHAAHEKAWDEGAERCAGCKHPGLEPCSSEPIYSWSLEDVTADAPGALPYLRVVLS